jgi:pimeloyl-ACP methyl ester carboxylesterase
MNRRTTVALLAMLTMAGCGGQDVPDEVVEPVEPIAKTGPGSVTSADGVEIAYTIHRIDRPNLVLVHGWMCDQSYWSEQVPALAEAFGVVTVDLAGHGASATNREQWTIPSLGADVEAVISDLGLEDVIVVGHSMGGLVAMDVARRLPDAVIGIIGIDTLMDVDAEWDPAQVEQLVAGLTNDFQTTCTGFVSSMFVEGSAPELVDPIVTDMCSGPGDIGAALIAAYADFDQKQAFIEAGVPIRSVNADLWPTDFEGNQALGDYDATILEGFGHFIAQEAPDQVTEAIIDTALEIVAGPTQAGEGALEPVA